jgi:parallel beta-helix repeat protein
VIENLAVRHYATPSQTGAIQANGTKNWTIRYVDASSNHALGIMAGPGTSLHHSRMNYNGQMGLRGESIDPDTGFEAPMIIEHNEIAHNHELGYNWMWEAGGLKILGSTGTVFRQNWVHDNAGPGIWFDGFNRATTIDSNLVENNTHIGIFYEISYGPTKIRWNIVRNNGAGQPGGLGAGILVMNSREVTVTGNAVDANQNGIIAVMADRELGPDGQLETTNVKVIGNDIRMLSGVSGLVDETSNDAYYTSKGNVFDENTYRVESPIARYFCWMGCWEEPSDWADWRSAGNDSAGQLLQANDEPILSDDALPFELVGYGPLS